MPTTTDALRKTKLAAKARLDERTRAFHVAKDARAEARADYRAARDELKAAQVAKADEVTL